MLMHSCSKEFFVKFSNPKMSRIPTFMPLSAALQRRGKEDKQSEVPYIIENAKTRQPIITDKTLMIIKFSPNLESGQDTLV